MHDLAASHVTNEPDTFGMEPAAGSRRRPRRARRRPLAALASLMAGGALTAGVGTVLEEATLSQILRELGAGLLPGTSLGGGIAVAALAGALVMRRVSRTARASHAAPSEAEMMQALAILSRQPNAAAGLVRLGDKTLLFSDCGQAFIMYACRGRSMVALFDPVGDPALWGPLTQKFLALAARLRKRPVFYQVSPEFLPVSAALGLKLHKLGEQAVIDLQAFSLAGGDWLKLRRSVNRAERDGLSFDMIAPADVPAVMDELNRVSEQWLAGHNAREKGFSLGTFRQDYVASEPVAVIRLEGRIVAFANVLTTASGGDAFIDLMRSVPGVHRGAMDLLFVRIMEHLKERGMRSLNLGMAPLAGLAGDGRAPLWNRIGRHVFEKGERFYNFRGVLAFKSKFDPEWQPRYLAVRGGGLPLASLLDVTLLIGGGLRGVLRRG